MSLSCQPQLPYAFGLGRSVFHLPWADNHTWSDLSTHVSYLFPILMLCRLHMAFSFVDILPNWTCNLFFLILLKWKSRLLIYFRIGHSLCFFYIAEMKVQMCAQYLVIASTTENGNFLCFLTTSLVLCSGHLENYTSDYTLQVLVGYCAVYIFMQTFMIPGTIFMSLLAGALFGQLRGLALVVFAATAGASSCYFLSKMIGKPLVFTLWPDKLSFFQRQVSKDQTHPM